MTWHIVPPGTEFRCYGERGGRRCGKLLAMVGARSRLLVQVSRGTLPHPKDGATIRRDRCPRCHTDHDVLAEPAITEHVA